MAQDGVGDPEHAGGELRGRAREPVLASALVVELRVRMPVAVSTGHVETARVALAALGVPESVVHDKSEPVASIVAELREALARAAR